MSDTRMKQDLRKLTLTSTLFSALSVVVLAVVFTSSIWLNYRVVQLTRGLQRSNAAIAAQQVTLKRQQQAIVANQHTDARNSCESVNKAYAASRALVRAEGVVQIRQTLSLLQRAREASAVNPPKNAQAQAARDVSDRFLVSLVTSTYKLEVDAIAEIDAKTKPLNCAAA